MVEEMSRPRLCRKIEREPGVVYFKPRGMMMSELEEVRLGFDELESVKLKDLMGLEQEDAAFRMGISQPTFCRLLCSARTKIAESIVKGKALRITGGDYCITGRTDISEVNEDEDSRCKR